MSHHKHVVEGEGFQAEVKVGEVGESWQAKVRLEDDGVRGKNVVLSAASPQELADKLGALSSAFTTTMNKVQELAATPSDGGGPVGVESEPPPTL